MTTATTIAIAIVLLFMRFLILERRQYASYSHTEGRNPDSRMVASRCSSYIAIVAVLSRFYSSLHIIGINVYFYCFESNIPKPIRPD